VPAKVDRSEQRWHAIASRTWLNFDRLLAEMLSIASFCSLY